MKPIDYGLSFISCKWPENSVRFWVESRLCLIDEINGQKEMFYQCGACKSEDTFAKENLFYKDNYDFTPVFGEEYGIIFRRKAYLNENYKTCPRVEDMWKGQIYKLKEPDSVTLLDTNESIRNATHKGLPIVVQTTISFAATGLKAVMEYPVKTMNINDSRDIYQVDTGPVLFPDLSKRYNHFADSISLAFIAFNVCNSADFVIERPTPIYINGENTCSIHHYSGILTLPADNKLFSIN